MFALMSVRTSAYWPRLCRAVATAIVAGHVSAMQWPWQLWPATMHTKVDLAGTSIGMYGFIGVCQQDWRQCVDPPDSLAVCRVGMCPASRQQTCARHVRQLIRPNQK
jgi:hypothetical protein